MVFTEDSKKDAKETVAQLRKEKKAFQDRIKEVKAEYMKPYDEFFKKASELVDMYDQPINFINDQIEAFEEQRIEAKKKEIIAIYDEIIPEEEWRSILPLKTIYNKKWENATCKAKDIKDELMEKKIRAKEALETIRSLESEKEAEAIDLYARTFDLTQSILLINNYEKQKREIMQREAERIQRETEERIRSEERAKIEAEQQKAVEIENAKAEAVSALIPDDAGDEAKSFSYVITMTDKAKEKLEMYMSSIGIEFEEMKF